MDLASIEQQLAAPDPEARRLATAALAGFPGASVVGALLRALGDEDWRVRKEATAVAIALAPDPDVLRALVGVFAADDENVGRRNAAVEAVAGYGSAAVDMLSLAIGQLDADGRKLAVEALGHTGEDAALIVLRSLVDDPDLNVRVAAVESLTIIGATCVEAVAPALLALLDETEELLLLTALTGLNDLGIAVPYARIGRWLEHPVLRTAALIAIGRSADPTAAPVLVAMLERSRGAVRDHVMAALVDFVRASPAALAAARSAFSSLEPSALRALLALAESEETLERRRRAIVLLGPLGCAAAATAALRALADEPLAAEAEEALVNLGAVAVEPLLACVAEGESAIRPLCIELVGQLATPREGPRVVAVLREALASPVAEEIAAALGVLMTWGDESCLAPAAGHLQAPSARVRRAAMAAFSGIAARFPDEAAACVVEARPDGDSALAALLVIGVTPERQRVAATDAVAFLSQALSHDDPLVRRTALEGLAQRGDASAVEAVVFALSDEEPGVRAAAARALGVMRGEGQESVGVEPLLDLVQRSQDPGLVAEAVRALGETAAPEALALLRRQVRDGAPVVAVAAIEAVARISSPDRVDALLEGIWHDDVEVVKAALQRLSAEKDARVRSHLIACIDHDAWDVRRLAADLLGGRGGEGVTARLRTRLTREAEPLVREAIQRALIEIESAASGIRRTTTSPPLRGGPVEP